MYRSERGGKQKYNAIQVQGPIDKTADRWTYTETDSLIYYSLLMHHIFIIDTIRK